MAAAGLSLSGEVALVTGASRGIGLAAARRLAEDGVHVILAARNGEACREAARQIISAGMSASAAALDVSDPASTSALAASIVEEHGRLDIVVNNAGVLGPLSSIADSDPSAWHATVAINLFGPYNVCRSMFPLLRPGATIINVSSNAADAPVDKMSAYSASKAGLTLLTRALADEWSAHGITVIGFRPGRVDTDMHQALRDAGANALSRIDRKSLAPTDTPARAIAYLCSPQGLQFHGRDVDVTELLPVI